MKNRFEQLELQLLRMATQKSASTTRKPTSYAFSLKAYVNSDFATEDKRRNARDPSYPSPLRL